MLAALALALSYMESFFPLALIVPLPGVKLGLANIVTLYALYAIGFPSALAILLVRCTLGALFAGNASALLFSLLGGLSALFVMALLSKSKKLSIFGVSIAGAAAHNCGQVCAALITLGSTAPLYYLPFLLLVSLFTGALSGLIVALDPGHGGYDGGARAQDSGRWEKDVALEIALEVEKALLARGAQVVLTRREDVCLADGDTASKTRKREDLQKRIDIAEAADADVLLSIHLNEYRSREESGPQVFYRHGSDQGRLLAGTLQQALLDGLKPSRERSALAGDYYVLGGTMPSVLVECGFLSNPREEALLLDPAYQQQIGQAIADGLEAYEVLLARTGQEDAA